MRSTVIPGPTTTSAKAVSSGPWGRVLAIALVLIGCTYLLQICTPLRLNYDAVVLLGIADEAARDGSYTYHGAITQYPRGYPFLVRALESSGMAASWSFVGMNLLFLAAGLIAIGCIYRRGLGLSNNVTMVLCGMALLSYVIVKHVTLPLSDLPFFGTCVCALAAMSECARDPRRLRTWLPLSIGLTLAATTLRTAGVALVPPLLWLVAMAAVRCSRLVGRVWKMTLASTLASTAAGVAWAVGRTAYFRETVESFRNEASATSIVWALASNAWVHFLEGGEAFINIPIAKAPGLFHFLYPYAGIVMVAFSVYSIFALRRRIGPVEIFAASYLLLLFGYAGYDARYWMPVLPILFGLCARTLVQTRLPEILTAAGPVYASWVLITGLAALAHSSRISLAGDRFPDLYGDGALRDTYRVALGLAGPEAAPGLNKDALHLLRKYGVRK